MSGTTGTSPTLTAEFESRWNLFQDQQNELEQSVKSFQVKINEDYKTRDKLLSKIKSQSKSLKELRDYADAARVNEQHRNNIANARKSLTKLSEELTPGSGR